MPFLLRAAVGLAVAGLAGPGLAQYRVGTIEITGSPADEPSPYSWLMGEAGPTLDGIVLANPPDGV